MSNLVIETLSLNPTRRRPVWIMRQAGRYMASYRKMREAHSFEDMCLTPELAFEVSMQPMRQFDFDASIVFSDILFPLRALGADLKFTDHGPQLVAPKDEADLGALRKSFDPRESTKSILETLKQLRKALPAEKAVLGFSGAPFTLAAYLFEGKLSKELGTFKKWMAWNPQVVHEWLSVLAENTGEYLQAQAEAGADAVQMFDTWAGALSPEQYEEFALPYARQALSYVTVPSIYYVNGMAGIIEEVASVGAQCLSIDWRCSIGDVKAKLPHVMALQGNLDPYDLYLPKDQLRERVFSLCNSFGTGPGHMVNLGHGIFQDAPEAAVRVFVDAVRDWSRINLKE